VLYIVLALVVAAFGLLIAALTTANTLWAWISVVVSVVAAGLLVADWLSGRRKARAKAASTPTVVTVGGHRDEEPAGRPGTGDSDWFAEPDGKAPPAESAEVAPESDNEVTTHLEPVDVAVAEEPAAAVDSDEEPDEEPTDASDLLVVAGLNVEVRVVDEHPRYHLATCTWLGPRPTIPIAVSEARQLGFTPCARCGPDAVLAARHRAAR
jgi:membrane protein implicated in regulation of membrane protease activity